MDSDSDSDDLAHLVSSRVLKKRSTLYRAVATNVRAVKILCRALPYTKYHVCSRKDNKCVLNRALVCQVPDIVQFLCDAFDIETQDILDVRQSQSSPENLYFESREFTQFLLERFDFCGQILTNTFMLAVKRNNLWLLQYLWDTHRTKFKFYYGEALRKAASHGHVDVLQFLKTTQSNHDVAVRHRHNGPLRKATAKGHMAVVQYLHTQFGLGANDTIDGGIGGLAPVYEASKNKRMDFLHYFFHDMGLTPAQVNADRIVCCWPDPKEWPSVRDSLAAWGCTFDKFNP